MPSFDKTINKEPTTPKRLEDKLVELVDVELKHSKEFWLPLLMSTIIATLGLLTNNAVVVIGAMLMAPLFWPLLGLTMGTITTRRHLMEKSLLFLILSIVMVVFISWLVTVATPINQITDEISLRTRPTLLDLLIALASSIIAIMAVSFPQVSNSIAGVAVSIALLPPLSVVGIGLANQSWEIFQGAFLLFGANMSAILFSGIVSLYALGLKPKRTAETRWRIGVILSSVLLIAISIPLTIYLTDGISQAKLKAEINNTLQEQLSTHYEKAQIKEMDVNFGFHPHDEVNIEATILLPEGNYLTIADKKEITQSLTELIGQTINLKLVVINTLTLRRQEDKQLRTLRTQVENWLTSQFKAIDSEIVLQNIELVDSTSDTPTTSSTDQILKIYVTARKYSDTPFTFDQKRELQDKLGTLLKRDVDLEIDFITVNRIRSQSELTKLTQQATHVIDQDLSAIDSHANVQKLTLEEVLDPQENPMGLIVKGEIWIQENTRITETHRQQIENDLAIQLQRPIKLILNVFRFKQLETRSDNFTTPTEVAN